LTRLPVVSGREAVKAFERVGFVVDRQKGSHIQLRQVAAPHRRLSVPDHRTLAKGLLRALIRDAGLSEDEFHDLLR
jgi:predicted RNA binding protein YcfA (HicA-like mRNA interferase family)